MITRVSGTRIFGIGLTRTGTTSLTAALRILGYTTCHFPDDAATRAEMARFLRERPRRLRLSVLDDVDAATDTPIACAFAALDSGYPGSRFILTVRERASWLSSCARFWSSVVLPHLQRHPSDDFSVYARAINRAVYGIDGFDADAFSRAYDAHVEAVHRHFRHRPAQLLVLDICGGDGWKPLCDFLGVSSVPSVPFPHENDMARAADAFGRPF